ncbi:hypothetical protein EG830_03985 [bacterium]|nr:hypothetical protein [bacterium]
MKLEQAAEIYRPVPLKALKRMAVDGLLTEPLDEKDQHALQLLSRLWADEWYVARMNMSFKSDKRALMLAFPDFGKIERYILSSYLPKEHEPRFRVSVRDVANNLRIYFHIEYPESKIKSIRQIAYNMLRSSRGECRRLFLSLTALERQSMEKQRRKSVK